MTTLKIQQSTVLLKVYRRSQILKTKHLQLANAITAHYIHRKVPLYCKSIINWSIALHIYAPKYSGDLHGRKRAKLKFFNTA